MLNTDTRPAKAGLWFPLLAAAVYLSFRILLIRLRYFDTDELEHLHAAWCVAQGQVMYKDFFEHHGPLLPFFLAPLTARITDPIHAIWSARSLMGIFTVAVLALQGWATALELGPQAAGVSILVLSSFTCFGEKMLEVRPDVPALALLSLAVVLALRTPRPTGFLGIGAALGTAFFLTPKVVYAAAGLVAAVIILRMKESRNRSTVIRQAVGPMALGALLPTALCISYFLWRHAGADFYRCFYAFNVRFRLYFPILRTLRPLLIENPVFWCLGCLGAFLCYRHTLWLGFLAGALVGLLRLPVPYPQYYLVFAPPLSFFAAAFLMRFRSLLQIALLALIPSFVLQGLSLRQSNAVQVEGIRCVMEHTAPGDRILDAWTGESFYRPHAFYFWFLHDEVRAMLRPDWLQAKLIDALDDPRSKGLIWGEYFQSLPAPVLAVARRNYHFSGCGRLFLRNAGPSADERS